MSEQEKIKDKDKTPEDSAPEKEIDDLEEVEEEPRSTVFVVGLGQTGRAVIKRLAKKVRIVGIDIEEDKIEAARRQLNDEEIELHHHDGTSRLTWDELGLAENDTVVVVTRRDVVNLEVCRIAKEVFGVNRLITLIHRAQMMEQYAAAGVETVNRSEVISSFVEARVFKDFRPAFNVGLGQGEIIEIPILPGSSVAGRRLSSFRARPWLVGAVYRQDKLIVPHGNTMIMEGDRVILIGEPHILSEIADFFKIGEPEFPLQYGPRIGVLAENDEDEHYEALVAETNYLAKNSKATSMVLLGLPGGDEPNLETAARICGGTGQTCEAKIITEDGGEPWPKALQAQDFGCLVVAYQGFSFLKRVGMGRSLPLRILQEAEYPILISKGTHPYSKILVPVSMKTDPQRVTQLAIDLARLFKAQLDAVTVTEPRFSVGEEAVEEQKQVLDKMVEHSDLYRLHVQIVHKEGNPIQEVADMASDYNLIVLGYQQGKRGLLPRLDMALEIMARVECSVMILPFKEVSA